MTKTNTKQEKEKMKALFQLGEQRARAAGHTGFIYMNDWLSENEQKQLITTIRALPQTMAPRLPGLAE
ncbi:hypothetical protein RIF25_11310 [Thermosynechococcaceae cyanobacterium BACA0444]|uniref:Uncharacterized protein n=1 Tax=Pseudocalidococcus azoricus BACA0444 TaxID=2918990 RepID=A0AAE4FSC2_9CYAN|nr:hypothetical protein [Pseudocalidococcus azoricus]MDS3861394.1 hypothetical protein [Pseudocalidococcus azoricus BACA0444]